MFHKENLYLIPPKVYQNIYLCPWFAFVWAYRPNLSLKYLLWPAQVDRLDNSLRVPLSVTLIISCTYISISEVLIFDFIGGVVSDAI